MKRFASTLYLSMRRNPRTKEFESNAEGFLYAKGIYPTKILPKDLPEWYVKGWIHRQDGYISAKGIKHLLYKPNYQTEHRNKDDFLFISYNAPIEPDASDMHGIWFHGYDHVVCGNIIVDILHAAQKYSNYDINDMIREVAKKEAWYQEHYT